MQQDEWLTLSPLVIHLPARKIEMITSTRCATNHPPIWGAISWATEERHGSSAVSKYLI